MYDDICNAIKSNDLSTFITLFDDINDPNIFINTDNNTLLHIACQKSYTDTTTECIQIVKILLESCADPNIKNIYDQTPFHNACRNKNINIIKELFDDPKTDPNIEDIFGSTPFSDACGYYVGDNKISDIVYNNATLLMDDPRTDINNGNRHPLRSAVGTNNIKLTIRLLEHPNIDIKKANNKEKPLMKNLCMLINCDMIKLLLEDERIDPNVYSIVSDAMHTCRTDILEMLLNNDRIDPNYYITGIWDHHPIIMLIRRGMDESMVKIFKLFCDHPKFDINIITKHSDEITVRFHDYLANPNDHDHCLKIIELIISHPNFDHNLTDKNGRTLLHNAAYNNCLDIVKLLLLV